MTDFDVEGLTARIENTIKLSALQIFPDHAKAWNAYEIGRRICKHAPDELRIKLDEWLSAEIAKPAVKPEPEPPSAPAPSTVNNISVGGNRRLKAVRDADGELIGAEIDDEDEGGAD
jgi:hypothetical protein